jgi:hypothetical protein
MTEMGTATIFSPVASQSSMCMTCPNRFQCIAGEGITTTVRNFQHLFVPDYKNSWTLYVDLPDCRQFPSLLNAARISASLYTGNRAQIEGKIVESHISNMAELHVLET